MRAIMAAVRAALTGMFSWLHDVWDWSWHTVGRGVRTGGRVAGATVLGLGRVAGAVASDAVALPGRLLGMVFGGGGSPSPQAAAQQAAAQTQSEQSRADDAADDRIAIAALRRVASAVGRGDRPEQADLQAVPPGLAAFVVKLNSDEAEVIARSRTSELRSLLSTGVSPAGVRMPQELAADLRAAQEPVEVVDRKADFRARLAARREAANDVAAAYAA